MSIILTIVSVIYQNKENLRQWRQRNVGAATNLCETKYLGYSKRPLSQKTNITCTDTGSISNQRMTPACIYYLTKLRHAIIS